MNKYNVYLAEIGRGDAKEVAKYAREYWKCLWFDSRIFLFPLVGLLYPAMFPRRMTNWQE